jgi:hypothetical protein
MHIVLMIKAQRAFVNSYPAILSLRKSPDKNYFTKLNMYVICSAVAHYICIFNCMADHTILSCEQNKHSRVCVNFTSEVVKIQLFPLKKKCSELTEQKVPEGASFLPPMNSAEHYTDT